MSTDTLERRTQAVRQSLNGPTMGSRWSAVFYGYDGLDHDALRVDLQSSVERVEAQMSTWKPRSDVNRLSAAPTMQWISVPPQLVSVLEASLHIGRLSQGLFDIGVGDLVRSWGFGGGTFTQCATHGFDAPRNLQVDPVSTRVRKLAPLRLDLSGIAKGFGVDELARVMSDFGVTSFLVSIDGDMRAAGCKPDGSPWVVGHEKPQRGQRELAGVFELRDMAVATSGNYRHVRTVDGKDVSHTMDPLTGRPVMNDLASVTVLALTCMVADAWATALMVAGAHRAMSMARHHDLSVLLVRTDSEILSTL